ncbi:hypothetical protein [Streptomyces sp. NPDC020747]|uniref:hypothetical protein n=1 Tax=Streptomyces sp. NPDC020747 TaxID=3365086 RepID=UPI00379F4CF8
MPAYLVIHPRGQKKDDVLLEADDLTLVIHDGWAIFSDSHGVCLAVPSGQGASIQRVDQQPEDRAEGA